MFKIQPNPTFWAKVAISIPGQDKPAQIEVEFRHLGREALKAYFDSLEGKTDSDALLEIVVNWRGVDTAFSRDAFGSLLDGYPTAAMSLFEAYRREVIEAKGKN